MESTPFLFHERHRVQSQVNELFMTTRKFFTEFAVNMFGDSSALLQQSQLESSTLEEALPKGVPYHIYMIVRRPRIAFDPSTIKLVNNCFSGDFTIQHESKFDRHSFETPVRADEDKIKVLCPYPHTEFSVHNLSGEKLFGANVALFLAKTDSKFWKHMDFEVLYIGQAYGEDGSRIAPDRLKSHSTLQSIYAEAIQRSPDKDIWIILWSFVPMLITGWAGGQKNLKATPEQDAEHADKVLGTEITEQQRINFTEAALIRYFQPEYNKTFKGTFPSPAHSTYAECYSLDLNTVNVELQTENIMCRLWSPSVEPKWVHFAKFQLHSPEDRKSMFDLVL